MKNILFCYKEYGKLRVRKSILTDVFVPVQDVISPQKTTLKLLKLDGVDISDIIIIRDNDSGETEYIGYIDTIVTKETTEVSCYPLINIFNNDFILEQLFETIKSEGNELKDKSGQIVYRKNDNGEFVLDSNNNKIPYYQDQPVDVVDWLVGNIRKIFVDTNDNYLKLPFAFIRTPPYPILYKKTLDTANLFEAYTDLFINTGVYIKFSLYEFDGIYIKSIGISIYCNTEEEPICLRYDNPQIQQVDIVDNTFTNYNKVIAVQEQEENEYGDLVPDTPATYTFYLLDDNSVTRDPNAKGRFKQVRSKVITFSLAVNDDTEEGLTEEEKQTQRAEALMLAVFSELQAKEYNLAITITMFKNDRIQLHKLVDFLAENGTIYTSRITKLEILNDKQIKVTLGALRNSITDFKKKIEEI